MAPSTPLACDWTMLAPPIPGGVPSRCAGADTAGGASKGDGCCGPSDRNGLSAATPPAGWGAGSVRKGFAGIELAGGASRPC